MKKFFLEIWNIFKFKLYLKYQMEIQIPNDLNEFFDILGQQKKMKIK